MSRYLNLVPTVTACGQAVHHAEREWALKRQRYHVELGKLGVV